MSGMVFSSRIVCAMLAAISLALVSGCSLSDSGSLDEENEPHYILGKSRVNALDYPQAIDAFNESLQVNPHSAAAHRQLACVYESETKYADPAAAIYHYQEFLRLKPQADDAENIKQRIDRCKVQLGKTANELPTMPGSQKLLETLSATNRLLQAEVDKWRAYFAAQEAANSRKPTPEVQNNFNPPPPEEYSPPTPNNGSGGKKPVPPRSSTKVKTHYVAKGESLAIIARKYHVSLESLQAANPSVNSKKLRVGQPINLPSP